MLFRLTSYLASKDECGVTNGPGGVFDYSDMVQKGFIDSKGNAANGFLHQFDECSQTVSSRLSLLLMICSNLIGIHLQSHFPSPDQL